MTNPRYEEKNKITINRSLLLTLVAGAFALGIFIGASTGLFSPFQPVQGEAFSEGPEGTFRFIRASVEAKHSGEKRMTNRELKPFQYKVNSLIESDLKNADAESISVYFRDLNNGNRFIIGKRDAFDGENHLKLPLMVAYFKWAESNPLVLRKKLIFGVKPETERHRLTISKLEEGKSYTVSNLIFRMIAYDDDAAYAMLSANMPANRLDKILKDLDGEYDPQNQNRSLSLNSYAALFRVLFNASYLSEEMSEKALRYLSKTTFQDGIASAVPPNVDKVVDHEEVPIVENTGEGDRNNVRQLQEFGIIYHQNRPFLLGVIARGSDDSRLKSVIRDVTRLVYQEVDQQS